MLTSTSLPGPPRTEAEPGARRNSELLELLLDATTDGVMDIDFALGVTTYNDRWRLLLGYESTALEDSTGLWRLLSHPDDLPEVESRLREHLEAHWPFNHTWRMRHDNGEWRWMLCRAVTSRNAVGEPHRLVAVFSDITDTIRNHENQRALVSAIPDLLLRLRGDGSVIDTKAPDETPDGIAWPVPGEFLSGWAPASEWHQRVTSCLVGEGQVSRASRTFEASLAGNPPRRRVEVRVVPGAHDEGVCIVRDVTDQRNLQSQLLQANKLESIGQLAAGIAHEINTPMQFIGDNLFFLQEAFPTLLSLLKAQQIAIDGALAGTPIDEAIGNTLSELRDDADIAFIADRAPEAIASAREGVGRVAGIVRAMKEFSHPGSKDKVLASLNPGIETTITVATNVWRQVATVEVDLDPNLPPVLCHSDEINQVVLNLIVNAAHAISDVVANTQQKGLIKINTGVVGQFVEIRVSDTGGGIPEGIRHRIFDPFFTTKEVGRGTGQGLALARTTVVDTHKGSIHFESNAGKGTTFVVRLPLA